MKTFFGGFILATIICLAVTHVSFNEISTAVAHSIEMWEADLYACEDAWQADLAESQFQRAEDSKDFIKLLVEANEIITQCRANLDKCHIYLERCPD
jgi:hypothetical protein